MKRVLLFLCIIVAASIITGVLMGQTKPPQPPRTYAVILTPEQWTSVLSGLESIKNTVKVSSMSAKESTFISDSLITIYQTEFLRQINKQIEAERPKPELKKDTTTKIKKP